MALKPFWNKKGHLGMTRAQVKAKLAAAAKVEANPTLTGTEADLTGLEVDDTKYAIPAPIDVEANPTPVGDELDLTDLKVGDTLTGLKVGDAKYQIHNILSYGHSRWKDFLRVFNNGNACVFCMAGYGTDPGSGNQTRLAILNRFITSGNVVIGVDFLYYRPVWPHSDSAQGDEIYIYTLRKNDTWSYESRPAYTKVAAGTNLTSTYNDNVLTLDTNAT